MYPETAPRVSTSAQAVKAVVQTIARRIKPCAPPYPGARMGSINVKEFETEAKPDELKIADCSACFTHGLIDEINDFDAATVEADAAAVDARPADAFVHAAGVLRVGELGMLVPADAEPMWRLHVDAAQRIANVVVPAMAERGFGRVVLVGSRVAQGMAGRCPYAATKAALTALARGGAAEVVARGVTVNVVSPTATQTAMRADPSRETSRPKLPPLGRPIRPE